MSHIYNRVVYENSFDNQLVDWSNKLNFTIPSDVKTVLIDIWHGNEGAQTAAENYIQMRMNNGTGASYCNARKYHNASSYLSATSVTDTSMRIFTCNTNEPNGGCSQTIFHTRNGLLDTHGIPYGQVLYHGATPSGFPLETRLIRVLDSVNPAASIQIFTLNSTNVCFSIQVRYVS